MNAKTLNDIRAIDKAFLTAEDVAPYLGRNPHSIRVQAKTWAPGLLFPVQVCGTRVSIPKLAFVKWAEENVGEVGMCG